MQSKDVAFTTVLDCRLRKIRQRSLGRLRLFLTIMDWTSTFSFSHLHAPRVERESSTTKNHFPEIHFASQVPDDFPTSKVPSPRTPYAKTKGPTSDTQAMRQAATPTSIQAVFAYCRPVTADHGGVLRRPSSETPKLVTAVAEHNHTPGVMYCAQVPSAVDPVST